MQVPTPRLAPRLEGVGEGEREGPKGRPVRWTIRRILPAHAHGRCGGILKEVIIWYLLAARARALKFTLAGPPRRRRRRPAIDGVDENCPPALPRARGIGNRHLGPP